MENFDNIMDNFENNLMENEILYEDEFEIMYEPEKISTTEYNLVACDKYDPLLFGYTHGNERFHYIVNIRFKLQNIHFINIQNLCRFFRYKTLEIAKCIYLESNHCVAIIKTFWLKLIQRKWKNICKDRKLIISKRRLYSSINYREIKGNWSADCEIYPTLKGMLYNLPRKL